MKTTILTTVVSMGMMVGLIVGTPATGFADEAKKANLDKPENLSAQVVDNSKDAGKSEPIKDEASARPYHFLGHGI